MNIFREWTRDPNRNRVLSYSTPPVLREAASGLDLGLGTRSGAATVDDAAPPPSLLAFEVETVHEVYITGTVVAELVAQWHAGAQWPVMVAGWLLHDWGPLRELVRSIIMPGIAKEANFAEICSKPNSLHGHMRSQKNASCWAFLLILEYALWCADHWAQSDHRFHRGPRKGTEAANNIKKRSEQTARSAVEANATPRINLSADTSWNKLETASRVSAHCFCSSSFTFTQACGRVLLFYSRCSKD
jgi:hypothetical protein